MFKVYAVSIQNNPELAALFLAPTNDLAEDLARLAHPDVVKEGETVTIYGPMHPNQTTDGKRTFTDEMLEEMKQTLLKNLADVLESEDGDMLGPSPSGEFHIDVAKHVHEIVTDTAANVLGVVPAELNVADEGCSCHKVALML